jgi:hypothetical protein
MIEYKKKNYPTVFLYGKPPETGKRRIIYSDELLVSGNQWLNMPQFDPNSDFNIEFDVYNPGSLADDYYYLFCCYGLGSGLGLKNFIEISITSGTRLSFTVYDDSGNAVLNNATTVKAVEFGTWSHIILSRSGNTFYFTYTNYEGTTDTFTGVIGGLENINLESFLLFASSGDGLPVSPSPQNVKIKNLRGNVYRFGLPYNDGAAAVVDGQVSQINNFGSAGGQFEQESAENRPIILTI